MLRGEIRAGASDTRIDGSGELAEAKKFYSSHVNNRMCEWTNGWAVELAMRKAVCEGRASKVRGEMRGGHLVDAAAVFHLNFFSLP